jgi:hypothetical protein
LTLREWLLAELTDIDTRLRTQVLTPVPPERRLERPGGGNSIAWAMLHIARHAELAIAVLGGPAPTARGGFGLGEVEPETWPHAFDPGELERRVLTVTASARVLLEAIEVDSFDQAPEVSAVLEAAEVPRDQFGWLYDQWESRPRAFFVSWPLLGHQTNHIGEMIAVRNRLGLSPYRA